MISFLSLCFRVINITLASVDHKIGKEKRLSKIGIYKGLLCSIESRENIDYKNSNGEISLISVKSENIKQKEVSRSIDRQNMAMISKYQIRQLVESYSNWTGFSGVDPQ